MLLQLQAIPSIACLRFLQANDTEEILAELNQAVAHDCEGLMVKTLETNASYEPCKRSLNWLKVGDICNFWLRRHC